MMRTRSSRFFVIMFHLVGVSHHSWSEYDAGIVAVQPWPLQLEVLQLGGGLQQRQPNFEQGTINEALIARMGNMRPQRRQRDYHLSSPTENEQPPTHLGIEFVGGVNNAVVWLQDESDESCLGPTGTFSECGDATLWHLHRSMESHGYQERRPSYDPTFVLDWMQTTIQHALPALWPYRFTLRTLASSVLPPLSSSIQPEFNNNQWTFLIADDDESRADSQHSQKPGKRRQHHNDQCSAADNRECLSSQLVPGSLSRTVTVLPCSCSIQKQPRWHVREDGSLQWMGAANSLVEWRSLLGKHARSTQENSDGSVQGENAAIQQTLSTIPPLCVHRFTNSTNTQHPIVLAPCPASSNSNNHASAADFQLTRHARGQHRHNSNNLEGLRLVRFTFIRYRTASASGIQQHDPPHEKEQRNQAEMASQGSFQEIDFVQQNHGSGHPQQPNVKVTSQLFDYGRHNKVSSDKQRKILRQQERNFRRIHAILRKNNPILFFDDDDGGAEAKHNGKDTIDKSRLDPSRIGTMESVDSKANRSTAIAPSHSRILRVPIHPYISQAINEVWTDPQTGLTYRTDLRNYLDKEEFGRHTLTGVGQYRKGYVIKVYGIAYYVSKRDVLMDPTFQSYAGLSSAELRTRPDFYEHLRKQNTDMTTVGSGVTMDRTILLKTNMQLSVETMRSSLQADWQYLTEEAKTTLMHLSLNSVPAQEEMLKIIISEDNPSRCSCSQVAPEHYHADPRCCARGTEMAFTWLKSGDLEVRLNGRIMGVFPRPDIAEGIFYEYLRYDNPISSEFLDHVVDGFPFLLAPLQQINDVQLGDANADDVNPNPFLRVFGRWPNIIMSQVGGLVGMVQDSAFVLMDGMFDTMQALGDSAQQLPQSMGDTLHRLGGEVDRRRQVVIQHILTIPNAVATMLSQDEQSEAQLASDWVVGSATTIPDADDHKPIRPHAALGRVFGYPLSRWFGETYQAPDEIGPMKIHPTMSLTRKFFLALVHLYLLLMFIVSFPGSSLTRTKLVIRRSYSSPRLCDDSLSASSIDHKSTEIRSVARHHPILGGVPEISLRSTRAMIPRRDPTFSHSSLLGRARQVLRPASAVVTTTKNDDAVDDRVITTSSMQKKSFSYFL